MVRSSFIFWFVDLPTDFMAYCMVITLHPDTSYFTLGPRIHACFYSPRPEFY